jgi:mismatch-specific thymine-DNA glycosylase
MLKPFLRANLDVLFVGFNPHPWSWERGRYYAHGSLWRVLRKSGVAPSIRDDSQLFAHNFGITDLVHDRPTREAREVADEEYRRGATRLRRQIARLRPRIVCFTGKGVYRHFARLGAADDVVYGPAGRFGGSRLFVAPFPSHKWMTDAEKAAHYGGLNALLNAPPP